MELQQLQPEIDRLQELFGLKNWVIKTQLEPNLNAVARTMADPMYLRATITFKTYPTEWTLTHEFIHIAMAQYDHMVDNTSPMETQSYIQVGREASVSQLTNIMLRIMK